MLLDSCQFLPHRPTDVQALGCDWLVASGHKMLAPTASGFLWGRWGLVVLCAGHRQCFFSPADAIHGRLKRFAFPAAGMTFCLRWSP